MSIWKMSAYGAVMVLIVAVIRALAIDRLPKNTFLALWGITLARLLVPYALPCMFSVYSLAGGLVPPAKTEPPQAGLSAAGAGGPPAADAGAAVPAAGVSAGAAAMEPYTLIWLAGALVCALFFAAVYLKCLCEFREALPVESRFAQSWLAAHPLRRMVRLRQSDRVSAPLTYGVFRPVVLLPKRTDWKDEAALACVLAHESVHIRRLDAVTKLALAAALCVHWFNPAVWLMYVLANRDLELSCDEAAIRLLGEHTGSAYAMALIRMKEIQSGLRPLCSDFGKYAIEERITAIMKMKKTTRLASAVALVLVLCVTTAFATSAQEQSDGPDRAGPDGAAGAQAGTARQDGVLISYTDPTDGSTWYSWDDGSTWTALSGEEAEAMNAASQAEWWTAEEYAAWLKEEKAALQSIIGERSWNPTDGWYTWTQQMVEEAIARYEQTLQDIRAGQKVSKPMSDGDTMVQFGYDPALQAAADEPAAGVWAEASDQTAAAGPAAFYADGGREPTREELLAEYGAFGISFDAAGKMMYQGRPVRWFADLVELEEGALATRYVYRADEGTEYLHTVRSRADNGDGSYDPFGPLVAIVPWEAGARDRFGFLFRGNGARQAAEAVGSSDAAGTTFAERFARYREFGITYVEADGASGRGNVYLNGQLVSRFADVAPDGGAFSFASAGQGGLRVSTVYDSGGNLTGLQAA